MRVATAALPRASTRNATTASSSVTPRCRARETECAISEVLPAAVDADEAAARASEAIEDRRIAHDVDRRVAAQVAGDHERAVHVGRACAGVAPRERAGVDDAMDRDVADDG